jgi:hypothetical protein
MEERRHRSVATARATNIFCFTLNKRNCTIFFGALSTPRHLSGWQRQVHPSTPPRPQGTQHRTGEMIPPYGPQCRPKGEVQGHGPRLVTMGTVRRRTFEATAPAHRRPPGLQRKGHHLADTLLVPDDRGEFRLLCESTATGGDCPGPTCFGLSASRSRTVRAPRSTAFSLLRAPRCPQKEGTTPQDVVTTACLVKAQGRKADFFIGSRCEEQLGCATAPPLRCSLREPSQGLERWVFWEVFPPVE